MGSLLESWDKNQYTFLCQVKLAFSADGQSSLEKTGKLLVLVDTSPQ